MNVPRVARYHLLISLVAMAVASAPRKKSGNNGEDENIEASDASTTHRASASGRTENASIDELPRTDLHHEEFVDWSYFEIVSERQLRFYFPTGDPKCYGSRAVVQEDPSTVGVAILIGTLPDAPSHCALVGRMASLLITVAQPVEGRRVSRLDASKATPTGL